MRALRRGNQLQQFLWVVQPLPELILLVAQRGGGNLCCHARVFEARIRGHETNLIDADTLRASEGCLQLQCQFGRFSFSGGKGACEAPELFLGDRGKELNAGKSRCRKQLRKLLFRDSSF